MAYDENGNLIEDNEISPADAPLPESAPPEFVQWWREWRANVEQSFKKPSTVGAKKTSDTISSSISKDGTPVSPTQDTSDTAEEQRILLEGGTPQYTQDLDGLIRDAGRGGHVTAEQVSLDEARQEEFKRRQFEQNMLMTIKNDVLARYHISNGQFDYEAISNEAQNFIKKPQVSDKALQDYKNRGPAQMTMPEIPPRDRQMLSKIIMSTFSSAMKSIAQGVKGGRSAAVGAMSVDPGTKIMAEEGRMLSAQAQEYRDKIERVRQVNFQLYKEWGDNVTRMQADLDNRLDSSQNAYDRMVGAYVLNRIQEGEKLLLGLKEKEIASSSESRKIHAGYNVQEEVANVGYRQQANMTNAQLAQSRKADVMRLKLARYQAEQNQATAGYDINGGIVGVAADIQSIDPDAAGTALLIQRQTAGLHNAVVKTYGNAFSALSMKSIAEANNSALNQEMNRQGLSTQERINVRKNLDGAFLNSKPIVVDGNSVEALVNLAKKQTYYTNTGQEIVSNGRVVGHKMLVSKQWADLLNSGIIAQGLGSINGDVVSLNNRGQMRLYADAYGKTSQWGGIYNSLLGELGTANKERVVRSVVSETFEDKKGK